MADILEIEDGVLKNCTDRNVTSIVIPSSVTEIGKYAFFDCESLSSVVISEGVEKIGWSTFACCKSLASVAIPASVTEIGNYAFDYCSSLTSIEFGGTMAQWEAVKGKLWLLEDSPAEVVKCADGGWQKPDLLVENGKLKRCFDEDATSVAIGEGVTEIESWAFYDCSSLSSVVIPSSVTKIGSYAFCDCKSLSSVVIPPSVTEIGENAFYGCNINELSHSALVIKNGVAINDGKVLYYASQSASIIIPEGVTEIGRSAFYDCKSLKSVAIPSSVTAIGNEAFKGCSSLSSVVIPEGVTAIGGGAFISCESLASVEYGGTVAQWETIEKDYGWHIGVPATVVKCTDGDAAL